MALGRPIDLVPNVATKNISVIAADGQTLFTVIGGYQVNNISVYRNGTRLADGRDCQASDGATVTLLSPAVLNDVIEFQVFDSYNVADAVGTVGDSTITGNLTIDGTLNVVGDIEYDEVTGRNINISGVSTFGTVQISNGIVTATSGIVTYFGDGSTLTGLPQLGVGIQSGGAVVGYAITSLNFIGVGNTFKVDGSTVDISIQGGGGGGGIGATSGISTYSLYSNQRVLTGGDYQLVNQDESGGGYNYGAFGPITVSAGSTIYVGEFDEFVII